MIELRNTNKSLDVYPEQAITFTNPDGVKCAALISMANDYDADPRMDDDGIITRMICWHRRYTLGDSHKYTDTADMLCSLLRELNINTDDETEQDVPKMMTILQDFAVVLPLWLYDHSGISMSCGERTYPYNDPWDSGQVGWIVLLKKDMEALYTPIDKDWRRKALEICREDIRLYNLYLSGEVYAYSLYEKEDKEWVEKEWCGHFYGTDILENGMTDNIYGLAEAIEKGEYKILDRTSYVDIIFNFG